MENNIITFYKYPEYIPQASKLLLVKYRNNYNEISYYILRYLEDYHNKNNHIFEEAGGEQYFTVDPTDVIGWLYIDTLNEIDVSI